MCAIAGIVNFSGPEEKLALLKKMIGLMRHRGPDEAGVYLGEAAGLGHARLSIIDLSSGTQPICNEDRSLWIVYNGEIYNHPELRTGLEAKGHRFYTRTDTEVLIHLYEELGAGMFSRLNGQFALAIWDDRKRQLLLGRDPVGIHPLFYTLQGRRLVLASEIKAFFADPSIPRRIDPQTLSDIFICWTPMADATAFETIRQLCPGHYAIFDENGFSTHRYWDIPMDGPPQWTRSLESWEEAFGALMTDATRIRLRADVPVGAYLSGGIDSTYTSGLIKRQFDNRLRTFSVAFTDERFDESAFQNDAVKALATEHQSTRCTESDIAADFESVIWHAECPMLRTAPAPLFRLSKRVRDSGFKVVLTGEGADEFFAGYNIYKEALVRRFWARHPASTIRPKLLERLYPYIFSGNNEKAKGYLRRFFRKDLEAVASPVYSHLPRWQNTAHLRSFFSMEMAGAAPPVDRFIERFSRLLPDDFMRRAPLSRAQYIEIKLFLANYLLSSQSDRMLMAHSVEGRYPFLDPRVVEFAFRLPPRYRMNGLKEKFIVKRAARHIVPETILNRPKQPFRAPIGTAFFRAKRAVYVDDMLSDTALREKGYFDPARVSALVAKCRRDAAGLLSERENMALVGILSTQLLDEQMIRRFPHGPIKEPENPMVRVQREARAPQ